MVLDPAEWTITIRIRLRTSTAIDAESPRAEFQIAALIESQDCRPPAHKSSLRIMFAQSARFVEVEEQPKIPRRPAKSSFERGAAVRTDATIRIKSNRACHLEWS